jgi:hypothetical protein
MLTSVTRASADRAISGMTVNQPGRGRQANRRADPPDLRPIKQESIIGRVDQNGGSGARRMWRVYDGV